MADLFEIQKLFYTPDIEIPEESTLVGVILIDPDGSRVGFVFRELSAGEAEEPDRMVVNGTLEEIAEACRNGVLDQMHKAHLRNLSLNLALAPPRSLSTSDRIEANVLMCRALPGGATAYRPY